MAKGIMSEKEALIRTAIIIANRTCGLNPATFYGILKRTDLILTIDEAKMLDVILKERLHYLYSWLAKTTEGSLDTIFSKPVSYSDNAKKAYKIEIELLNRALDVIKVTK